MNKIILAGATMCSTTLSSVRRLIGEKRYDWTQTGQPHNEHLLLNGLQLESLEDVLVSGKKGAKQRWNLSKQEKGVRWSMAVSRCGGRGNSSSSNSSKHLPSPPPLRTNSPQTISFSLDAF